MKSFGKRNNNVSGSGIAKLASGIPLVLLALAAAVVAIAGISVVRHEAGTDGIFGLGFTWFVIAATFFVLFAAFVYLLGSSFSFISGAHSAIVGLLAIVTVLCILETEKWNGARTSDLGSSGKIGKGTKTAFAGFISLAVLLSLLIMVIGNSASVSRGHNREAEVYQTTQVHSNPAHATGPATATATV